MLLKLTKPLFNLTTLLLLGFIWGTGYSIARFAMTNGVPPLGYSFWQSLGPAILIGAITYFSQGKKKWASKNLFFYLICGITGIAIPNTVMYFAAPHLPAGILAMIVNTVPIMAYPLALLLSIEKFNWKRLIGILLAFLGLMLVLIQRTNVITDNHFWVLLALLTPFCFALCSIYISLKRPPDASVLSLTSGMLFFSSLLLLPLVVTTHQFYLPTLPFSLRDWVILAEIILSSIGYLLFFFLIKTAGPVYYSLVDTIVVMTGLFWGYVIFNEHLNWWSFCAVILIIIALLLVTSQQRLKTVNI